MAPTSENNGWFGQKLGQKNFQDKLKEKAILKNEKAKPFRVFPGQKELKRKFFEYYAQKW